MSKMIRHTTFTALAFLFNSFCIAQKVLVVGIVRSTDGALAGATVTSGQTSVVTNLQGEFSIEVQTGNQVLYITHSGYQKVLQHVNLVAGQTLTVRITMTPVEKMEEVVVTGSRSLIQRSNLTTTVPVDVISFNQLLQTAQTSLTQMLQFVLPSLNASRPLVNEPVTLRGLEPDQLLILVNGRRYPNMSFLNWGGVKGILGRGAVSNDLNSIPFSAIEKIEILRDGASAQYGSDAIAGVINIRLKNSVGKTWAQLQSGQYYKGDGDNVIAGINHGFLFLKNGFLNLSFSYRTQEATDRGGRYNGTVYTNNVSVDDSMIKARNFNRNNVSNAGTSKHSGFGLLMNGGYSLSRRSELFWTLASDHRVTVFASGYTLPKNSARINPELFPDGYKPQPGNYCNNVFAITGIKGQTTTNWNWEYSSSYGRNRAKYDNKETNNASQYFTLGKNAPTSFYTGSLVYEQLTNNFQLTKNFAALPGQNLNLGFGGEWRLEHYQIKEGEEASWKNYDVRKQGGSGGLVLSPFDAVRKTRNIASVYVDVESEFSDRLLIGTAARYEYYNDFGNNLAGKIAVRYKVDENFSLRGSLSNGFRAPSLQQRYYSHTRIGIPSTGGVYAPVTAGIFPNSSAVTEALGIASLQAERSVNLSAGFTTRLYQHITLTADAYHIQIRNRIVLSGAFERTVNHNADSLLRGLTDVNQVQFFANAINTKTKGIDIVLNGGWQINDGTLQVMFAANFTQTKLFGEIKKAGKLQTDSLNTNTLFGREEKGKLEKGQPSEKIILSANYQIKKIGVHLLNTRFGKTAISSNNLLLNADEYFSSKLLTDFSISYSPKKWIKIAAGANNIFNVYPDRLKDYRNTSEGTYVYPQEATPFGINGGYYFIMITANQ